MAGLIDILNRRLGERLGLVCGGSKPRFSWKYAPEQPRFVYDRDNRTLLKRSWADAPAPDGGTLGRVWLLAEWRKNNSFDHHGFGDGIRVPFIKEADYAPYFETALAPGAQPTEALTANYIAAIDQQMQTSHADFIAEEAYSTATNERRDRDEHRERSAIEYDKYTGAFGNLEPGKRDGYMSFQNVESR